MIISSIKRNSPGGLSVILEDGEEIKTTLGVVTDLRLFSGRDLDEAALEDLRLASRRALARDRALAIVSQRQMSRRELGAKLRDKGVDEETAAWCVDWITEHGFIDEEAYAAAIARHYAAKGYGEGRVRQELMRRGIPSSQPGFATRTTATRCESSPPRSTAAATAGRRSARRSGATRRNFTRTEPWKKPLP